MNRRVLVLVLTSLFALLPQGHARVTICIANPDVGAALPAAPEHACCAAGGCEEPRDPTPGAATIEGLSRCDCCLEFDAATARDPATTPHQLDRGGVVATLPRLELVTFAPRRDHALAFSHERARTERPPPRFALRI